MTAEDTSGTRTADPAPDPARWRILAVTLAVGFMSLLDVTIVNVAIPSMRSGLDTSAATIQWVVSGYALSFGLVLVTGGRLGDAWGRRRLMLIGLAGFVLASAACGLAPTAGRPRRRAAPPGRLGGAAVAAEHRAHPGALHRA
ncbi:MFS transporter [Serinicoccus sp. CUA-874]|uniref:MFS transporter n=1 Tax=Serinicoccus sp. CUA-874 TaxID=1517939 RepID=UPI0022A9E4AA|nr:MFS transporter [Serinicoccus sp. CUA-874]